jgi:hypothetical protein
VAVTSVHDNLLYAQIIDHDRCRITLHTVYPHATPVEFTDVVFDGVVVHHFEQQKCDGDASSCVLFEVEAVDPRRILNEYTDLLARTKKYSWPIASYSGLDDLAAQLTSAGTKCFEVHGVCGIQGFVFAASMELRQRPARAEMPT